jgi:hypothetical protein
MTAIRPLAPYATREKRAECVADVELRLLALERRLDAVAELVAPHPTPDEMDAHNAFAEAATHAFQAVDHLASSVRAMVEAERRMRSSRAFAEDDGA